MRKVKLGISILAEGEVGRIGNLVPSVVIQKESKMKAARSIVRRFAVLGAAVLGVAGIAQAATIPVEEGGDIAAAIAGAADGDVIELAAGTYALTAQLKIDKPITLQGAGADQTIIDGGWGGKLAAGQSGVMCLLVNNKDAVVSDLTVRGGYSSASTDTASQGVGIRIAANGGTVRNCVITENCKWSRRTGCAGVFLNSVDAVLENCVISDNKSSYGGNGSATDDLLFGAGVMCVAGRVSNCTIMGNTGGCTHSRGNGLYLGSANATADHCVIRDNLANYANTKADGAMKGVGVYMVDGVLDNCLIVDNTVKTSSADCLGGGLYQLGGTVVNCTFADNSAYAGGGVYTVDGTLANCLVSRNVGSTMSNVPEFEMCAGSCLNCCVPSLPDETEAQFTDCILCGTTVPFGEDYRLEPSSMCIDKGKDGLTTATLDAFGDLRVQGDHIDIGASEGTPPTEFIADFIVSAASVLSTEPVVFTAQVSGPGVTDDACTFIWTNGDGEEIGYGKTLSIYFEPSVQTISLYVSCNGMEATVTKQECVVVADGHVYLEKTGTQTPPYNTPELAFTNLEDAVAFLREGMKLSIGEGVFKPTASVTLAKRFTIEGLGGDKSVIDGGRQANGTGGHPRVVVLDCAEATVRGVCIQNGSGGTQGAGVYIGKNGGTLENCWIRNNVNSAGNSGYGAGVQMEGPGLVTHCRISGNQLTNGSAAKNGAGIYMTAGRLENCLIDGNSANLGSKNLWGGGVAAVGGEVVNCTIANNSAYNAGGLYVTAPAQAINCIVYGNAASSAVEIPDFNLGATNRAVSCCLPAYAATLGFPEGTLFASVAPYDENFALPSDSICVDEGTDGATQEATDYFGAERVQGGRIDIGCAEATPSAEMIVTSSALPPSAVGATEVSFVGNVKGGGVDADSCAYEWTVGGETFTGRTVTRTLPVGRYDVTLKVTAPGGDVKVKTTENAVVIYPSAVRVELGAEPVWPYDTAANAFTNLCDAVEFCRDGMTITVGEGTFDQTRSVKVSQAVTIIGAGMDKTVLRRAVKTEFCLLTLDNVASSVMDMGFAGGSVSTSLEIGGAVTLTQNGGGLVDRCRVFGCSGRYAVCVNGASSRLTRSIICDNACSGVRIIEGGTCDNCLITGNTAEYGAGVTMNENSRGAGHLRNCTIIGNHATSTAGTYSGAGVYAVGVTASRDVVNCLIYGNTLASEVEEPPAGYPDAQGGNVTTFKNCFTANELTGSKVEDCIFGVDPKVRTNGKIKSTSPCRRKGLYQDWMAEATDLFGNPRVDAKALAAGEGCVDIGCHQAADSGAMLLVR